MTSQEQSSSEGSSLCEESWITWFCGLAGNQFFCEIDKGYIDDAFNLFGLKQHFPKDYNKALDTILDRIAPHEIESEELSRSAALLFGLIHARYIVTSHGLEVMHRKYVMRDFGECPRTLCRGQAALPMGFTDEPKHGAVKLFCPRCQDIYNCHVSQRHIDGAFFGPTFPNLFMMSFEELVPDPPIDRYVPRVFGFKIHPSSGIFPNTRIRRHLRSGGESTSSHSSSNNSNDSQGPGQGQGLVPSDAVRKRNPSEFLVPSATAATSQLSISSGAHSYVTNHSTQSPPPIQHINSLQSADNLNNQNNESGFEFKESTPGVTSSSITSNSYILSRAGIPQGPPYVHNTSLMSNLRPDIHETIFITPNQAVLSVQSGQPNYNLPMSYEMLPEDLDSLDVNAERTREYLSSMRSRKRFISPELDSSLGYQQQQIHPSHSVPAQATALSLQGTSPQPSSWRPLQQGAYNLFSLEHHSSGGNARGSQLTSLDQLSPAYTLQQPVLLDPSGFSPPFASQLSSQRSPPSPQSTNPLKKSKANE